MSAATAFLLVGPTAVGKTAVAHQLARQDGYDILSADSMAIYRGMDVGTAKPTAAERAQVAYAGIDLADPGETFNVGSYLAHARVAVSAAAARGRPLLVVGGTGLYIKCLTAGLTAAPGAQPEVRARYQGLFEREGVAGLQDALRKRAPERLAALADPRNPRRLLRALELAEIGHVAAVDSAPAARPHLLGLQMDMAHLQERIAARVTAMYAGGLLEEARWLRERTPVLSATAAHAIGYAEAFQVLDGQLDEKSARLLTAQRTRQLAKRQLTWFRHQATMTWIDVNPHMSIADMAAAVRAHWNLHGPTSLAI